MNDAEKAAGDYAQSLGDCYSRFMTDDNFIPAIFLAGVAWAQGWIPVSERLPRMGQEVLAIVNGIRDIFRRTKDEHGDGWLWHGNGFFLPQQGTHWQPLPAAPKEEQSK